MSDDDAPPGAHPDRYQLGSEIARGGMGRVIEAVDLRLGRTVAIKQMLAADGATRRRFEREVRITARLEHPSIVPVHDAGEWRDGEPFYVMRKVSGRPLDELIAAAGSLDARLTLLPHMAAVVDAIAHAHGRGIVHRDLKPANVLIGEHGETLVIDWGLAKAIDEEAGEASGLPDVTGTPDPDPESGPESGAGAGTGAGDGQTRAGEVFGTPGFMAPEQALAVTVDARTDVFALGACLYQLLAGVPPFHGASSATEVLDRTVAESPAQLRGVVAGVPPDLAAIVEKAMAIDPAHRYADAAGLRDDLRRFLAGQLVAAHHYSPAQRVARTVKRYRAVIAVTALAVVILVVIGVLALRRMFADRDRIALARTQAVAALVRESQRADELVVTQAGSIAATNPTLAIATLKQLRPDSPAWDHARKIVAAARAAGIARGYPGGGGDIARAALGPDNRLVTTAGSQIMLHDLDRHSSKVLADATGWIAVIRWAGRRIVWRDDRDDASQRLHVVDPDTGIVRAMPWPVQIQTVTTARDGTVIFTDNNGAVETFDIAVDRVPEPVAIALPEPAQGATLSPGGEWLVIELRTRSLVFRRGAGGTWTEAGVIAGAVMLPQFSLDETRFAAAVPTDASHMQGWADVVEIELTAAGAIERRRWHAPQVVELMYTRDALVAVDVELRLVELIDHGGLRPPPFYDRSHHVGRLLPVPGGAGWASFGADNRIVIQRGPLRSSLWSPLPIEQMIASPTSPYLIALARSEVLVWKLDDTLPAISPTDPSGLIAFVDDHTLLATVHASSPEPTVIGHDVTTGAVTTGPEIPFTFGLSRIYRGRVVSFDKSRGVAVWLDATLDRAHPIPIAGTVAALDYGPDHLVVATGPGAIHDLDLRSGTYDRLTTVPGMETISSIDRWVVVTAADGTVWRRSPDGREQTLRLDPPAVSAELDTDGTAVIGRKGDFMVWAPDGTTRSFPTGLPLEVSDLIRIDTGKVAVVTADSAVYVLDVARGTTLPALAACGEHPAFADRGLIAATLCGSGIEVADLATGDSWTLDELPGTLILKLALAGNGEWLAVIAGNEIEHGFLVVWHLGLPGGSALAAWVQASTNATAPHAGKIEWR